MNATDPAARRASPGRLAAVLAEELPSFMEAKRIGGFVWDLVEDKVHLSRGGLAVFDLVPDEFDGHPDTLRSRMVAHDSSPLGEAALSGAEEYGAYFRVRSNDGDLHWAHAHAWFVRDDKGTALRAVGLVRRADAELGHAAQQSILASERSRQMGVVQAVTAELSRVLTVADLLDFVTSQSFLDHFGAAGVALSVLEQDRRRLLATAGLPAALLRDLGLTRVDSPLPLAETIRSQVPMFITREEVRAKYSLLWPYIEETELTATAVIPLTAQAKPTGALAMLYKGKREFSPEERNLLLTLGATFAQSLQRALLYDREHAMSVALQESMLPAGIPRVGGLDVAVRYRPTRTGHQVGGDWYDVIPGPGGRVMLVIGDVQGHDVQAAAVMGQLRSALRAYAGEGHPPATVMARASRFLHDLDTDLMATCICVDLDPATGTCQVVRAGHPYPVVRRADRRSTTIPVPGGLPLGLPPHCGTETYPVTELHLGRGAVLLLCTDGLLEARDFALDAGERRICALLDEGPDDLDALADHIVAALEQPRGDHDDHDDDMALLVASRSSDCPFQGPDGPAEAG